MIRLIRTQKFDAWLANLRDIEAKSRINARIERIVLGSLGDIKPVGGGVSELRINYGPGYRIYVLQQGKTLIILLAGGSKQTQSRDIRQAIKLARDIKENESWPL